MNFDHFQFLVDRTFAQDTATAAPAKYQDIPADRLPPLVLAYIGDAWFTLYVRTKLLWFEQNKVRVLHTHSAKMVSATMQAAAYRALESQLTEAELDFVRRGRNAKSTVPKSATVGDYRYSTGFEALLGYLLLSKQEERLAELCGQAFVIISREMTNTAIGRR